MDSLSRRKVLEILAGGAALAAGCSKASSEPEGAGAVPVGNAGPSPSEPPTVAPATVAPATEAPPRPWAVLSQLPLGFQWKTEDPFLFCVHHDDKYPRGNDDFGPAASLAGRNIGNDFEGIDGYRMYHGDVVPGFPAHPHRGFETVTVVRRGLLDHADSMGAAARYGHGDVQWLTAGKGIQHAEMFPLLEKDQENPVELFQIWLNLPAARKMANPHFSMFWSEKIPRAEFEDAAGRRTRVSVVAGELAGFTPLPPPPDSWASGPNDVAIWAARMDAGAEWTMPAAQAGSNRAVYFFAGDTLWVDGREVQSRQRLMVAPDVPLALRAGASEVEFLVLQGKPIGEPVVNHGPFVMNNRDQIRQAISDYQRTRFGGWPWDREDPVHGRRGRFARLLDGTEQVPT